jgi:hypothetical protein
MIGSTADGATMPALIMSPGIAQSLYAAGLTTKAAVIQWVSDNDWMTLGDYQDMGWYDFGTSGGTRNFPGTTVPYKDTPPNTPWHEGNVPTVLVTNTGGDECIMLWGSWGGGSARPIDPWR